MTLDSLNRIENLSVRSFNICNDLDLHDLKSIVAYLAKHKTFLNIRNCGEKSNNELIAICDKYYSKTVLIETINGLSFNQREVINSFILVSIDCLSVRSNNAIKQILDGNYRIENFLKKIYSNNLFNIHDIKNVGEKSAYELNQFLNHLKYFVLEISAEQNESILSIMKNKFFIQKKFSVKKIPDELCSKLTIFGLVHFLISENSFFGKKYDLFLVKALKVYDDFVEMTLSELGKLFLLTRERVRQIRVRLAKELLDQLSFTRMIEEDLYKNYGIDTTEKYLILSELQLLKIQKTSNTNFSKEFIYYILYSYCIDQFKLIGEITDVIQHNSFKSRGRHNWSNFYLVQKDICNNFDFEKFANNISERLKERRNEGYSLKFKSFLSHFITNGDYGVINDITRVCENILNNEFSLFLDSDENIVFKRNTLKQVHEYAIEILEEIGEPTKIEDLYEHLSLKQPNATKNVTSLGSSIRKSNEIIYFGRTSTFGLRKWENEKEGIKGGTIRSIVKEFLETKTTPIHISEITDNVVIYRPNTNKKNIYSNLKMDESGLFVFFQNSFIGLSRKAYSSSYLPLSTIPQKNWNDRLNELISFLTENERFPYSSGVDEHEIKLYRWYCVQKSKKDTLKDERKHLFENFLTDFASYINFKPRKNGIVNNSERLAKLKSFQM